MCASSKIMPKETVLVLVGQADADLQNPIIQYVTEQLHMLNYNIDKTLVASQEETVLEEQIKTSIEQRDIVVIVGGLRCRLVGEVLSKILHQKLIPSDREDFHMPMHAKLLNYSTFNQSNNVESVCPIVYVQGVLLVTSDLELLKPSFNHIAIPFLSNFNKKPVLKRTLTLCGQNNNFLQKIPHRDNVDVSYVQKDDVEVTLASSHMPSLLRCEQSFKEVYAERIVKCTEGSDIPKSVYGQSCYSHVRYSIECIEECFAKYGPENVFLSFNGGKDCTVLLHLTLGVLRKHYPAHSSQLLCLYVESANAFSELNDFVSQLHQYYDLNMIRLTKNIKESLAFILETKPHMKACLMGTRRTDPYCEHLEAFQMTDPNWPQVMRVSPLLEWHYSEIWDYLLQLAVPYCSLYDMGYTSLGSVTNTVKNPSLVVEDASKGGEVYLPAYKLLDASKERNGRLQT